jgi:D-alanyl-D-alanine carboxypeptidase (penicillin-binding protein 5/6)
VLAGYRERLRLPPASLTKILTALIATTYLPASAHVKGTRISESAYPNQVGIEKGVGWPLREVLQSLLVYSANDAAYAIAQRVSGSLTAFEPVMERSAREIGMSDSPVFHDPAGLDGTEGVGGGNLVSARDLAIAGRDLLSVPELASIVKERGYDFIDPTGRAVDLPSMNYAFLVGYPGAIGLKTGFTDRAGACIMAAATRRGRTMLAVVMNAYNDTATAIDLLNQGFATPQRVEPTTDRLPPRALPSPTVRGPTGAAGLARAKGRATGHAGKGRAGDRIRRPGGGQANAPAWRTRDRVRTALPLAQASSSKPAPAAGAGRSDGGLWSVVRTWPAKVLLGLAALGLALAIVEFARIDRGRRRSGPVLGLGSVSTAGIGLGRRRREQLVASYRRHERR